MSLYLFLRVPRNVQGNPVFEEASIVETFQHATVPVDRLNYWCKECPNQSIYVVEILMYGIGHTEFKVTRTAVNRNDKP